MALPKFRYVRYLDDGVNEFECLMCHEKWDSRSCYRWQFCPFCGSCWDGELKWDEEKKYHHYRIDRQLPPSPFAWVIQEQTFFRHRITEWKDLFVREYCYNRQFITAKDMLFSWKHHCQEIDGLFNEDRKLHEKHFKDKPFEPFSVTLLRMIRRKGRSETVILPPYNPTKWMYPQYKDTSLLVSHKGCAWRR